MTAKRHDLIDKNVDLTVVFYNKENYVHGQRQRMNILIASILGL